MLIVEARRRAPLVGAHPARAKSRRAYIQDKKPIKQICRELRVSRKTVRKVIRSGATEFTYERSVQPAEDRALASRALWHPGRERAAAEASAHIRLFEELRALGYDGGYDAVRRYAATWSKAVPRLGKSLYAAHLRSGRGHQFDWSHEIAVIDGHTTTVKVARVRLCHSRMVLV